MFLRPLVLAATAALSLSSVAIAATPPSGHRAFAGVRDLGRAPGSVPVRIAVVLNYHHDAEVESLTESQADPDSSLYHHFLTPSQFRTYFAPTRAEYARVVAALQRGGLNVTHTFANRTVVDATAPAPVVAKFFSTEIHRVVAPDGRVTYANMRPTIIPRNIAGLVFTVTGLEGISRMHPEYVRESHRSAPIRDYMRPNAEPVFGPDGGYGPLAYVNSYDMPALQGKTGSGRASGVATDGDFLDSDLSAFIAYFDLSRTGPPTTRLMVDGGPGGLNEDSIETTLDVETIVSISPGTALYVYEAPLDEPTNSNFIDIYNSVVNDNLVDTLNSSYIYCETAINDVVPGYTKAVNQVERQGNLEGITFHAGSGDTGSQVDPCYSGVSVGEPVDTPHNTAIGGTELSVDSNGHETSEVGWDGTGGGVSVIFKVPLYQRRVKGLIKGGRNIPDLAFDSVNTSLYFEGGFDGPIGGTSLASPIFGGALAQINQVQGSRAGQFDVTLYKTWKRKGYGSGGTLYFRDITQGSIPPYHAAVGYDLMSGIGAMQVSNFLTLLPH